MRGSKAAGQHPSFELPIVQHAAGVEIEQPAGKHTAVADSNGHKVPLNGMAVDRYPHGQTGKREERHGGLRHVSGQAEPLEQGRARLDMLDDAALNADTGPEQPLFPIAARSHIH